MSGGFKWLQIPGELYMVIADEEGKILAHVIQAPKNPARAYVGERLLGAYITNEQARMAVEAEMSEARRYDYSKAGKPVDPVLPMDERAWMEEPQ